MQKYSVGDKVVLRSDLIYMEGYGECYVNSSIYEHLGMDVTIEQVIKNGVYAVEEFPRNTKITDEMIFCKITENEDGSDVEIEKAKCTICGKEQPIYNVYNIDGKQYCKECMDKLSNIVMDYHEKIDWNRHVGSKCTRYNNIPMGFELEYEIDFDTSGRIKKKYYTNSIKDIMGDLVCFENDSSVSSGFEMISEPMDMCYIHENANKFKEMFEFMQNRSLEIHNECGFHIHVDKNSLKTSKRSVDEVIDNIYLIVETFKDEMQKFARRNAEYYARFISDSKKVDLKKIKRLKKKKTSRYIAFNIQNENTVEFRMFKSTIDFNVFMATFEIVNNIVNIAKYKNIDGLTWSDIINYHNTNNAYLVDYNNTLGIKDLTKKIQLLSSLEQNKEKFSIDNFIKGKFVIAANKYSDYLEGYYELDYSSFIYSLLVAKNITFHDGAYSSLFDCLSRKIRNEHKICVIDCNGKKRIVTFKDEYRDEYGMNDEVDIEELIDTYLENPKLMF